MWVINDIEVYQPTGSMGAQGYIWLIAEYVYTLCGEIKGVNYGNRIW